MLKELEPYKDYLPANTLVAWEAILPLLPDKSYLVGGTALTMHLQHRISRDLDFCVMNDFDPSVLLKNIRQVYDYQITRTGDGTLNGIMCDTKIEIMRAYGQVNIADSVEIAGLNVASIPDLLAMKLKTINDRGAWRDYFDIYTIDTQTDYSIEQGLEFFLQRFVTGNLDNYMATIPQALAYTDDVLDDFGITEQNKVDIVAYFENRLPSILKAAYRIVGKG